ncbi:SRPBCC family protein [Paenarthrobacter sp. PH39-S1]|uniref:SRPBCC family protein n=1 Tax=Paenarthrobacter sp. PH39-S1 TaxID=3046204 RepID=UPI0024BB53E8|nr:SRPBCC family protein [Paenarthrobacter sp. PH39-S1]MDJ0355318.1 SRPBCC family protein [Paenarthrobacter sp. PH39-S1]
MVDVQTETVIDRPCPEVAGYAADRDNAPRWYQNIASAQWRMAKQLQVGSEVAFTARFLGRDLDYVYRITELVPREKLVMRTAEGPFPMRTTYTWTALDDRTTRMTLRNKGSRGGFHASLPPSWP